MAENARKSIEIKKILETTEIWFQRGMLRRPWTEPASDNEGLKKMEAKGTT